MHLSTEVTSTTNHQMSSMESKNSSSDNNNQNKNDPAKTNNNGFLTAQELAERTIDSLLAEHPGELVRTGSPHIVIFRFSSKHLPGKPGENWYISWKINGILFNYRCVPRCRTIGDRIKLCPVHSRLWLWEKWTMAHWLRWWLATMRISAANYAIIRL